MGAELIRLSSFRFNKANTSNYTFTASIYYVSNTTQLWTQSYTTSSSCNPTCSVTVTNPPILLAGTTYVVRFSGSLGTTWIDNQGLYFQKSQLKANNDSLTLNFGATTGNTLNILANDTDESGAANVGTTAGTVRLFTSGTSKDGTNTPLGCTPVILRFSHREFHGNYHSWLYYSSRCLHLGLRNLQRTSAKPSNPRSL